LENVFGQKVNYFTQQNSEFDGHVAVTEGIGNRESASDTNTVSGKTNPLPQTTLLITRFSVLVDDAPF
jgi:hypothetical protein